MPARRAQPLPSGPCGSHRIKASGAARSGAYPTGRSRGSDDATRIQIASHTAAAQSAVSPSSQLDLTSLPVPRPCITATGQDA